MTDRRRQLLDLGLLLLRLALAAGMIGLHGWPKLEGFDEKAAGFPDPLGIGSRFSLGLAVAAEVGAALLVGFGLLTRVAAVPLAFTMAVAAFVVHGADPLARKELALAYLAVSLFLVLSGPGRFSLDAWVFRRGRGE